MHMLPICVKAHYSIASLKILIATLHMHALYSYYTLNLAGKLICAI
jgi:hypothetical protein